MNIKITVQMSTMNMGGWIGRDDTESKERFTSSRIFVAGSIDTSYLEAITVAVQNELGIRFFFCTNKNQIRGKDDDDRERQSRYKAYGIEGISLLLIKRSGMALSLIYTCVREDM
jgi:hypothetical protein